MSSAQLTALSCGDGLMVGGGGGGGFGLGGGGGGITSTAG